MASASLLALLAQQTPVQTRKGLVLTGLQNDFLSPHGKLPVSTPAGFFDRLDELVKEFREQGDIIWVRSHFKENRDVNLDDDTGDTVVVDSSTPSIASRRRSSSASVPGGRASPADARDDDPPSPSKKAKLSPDVPSPSGEKLGPEQPNTTQTEDKQEVDEELFLTRTTNREPCCVPGSFGADYAERVQPLIDERRDLQMIKTYYSAFQATSLLTTLRGKLVTELYICGCTTNLSAFATAMDAARHGIRITLIDDCLGYRRKERHDTAIKRLKEIMGARVMTCAEVIDRLRNPRPSSGEEDEGSDGDEDSEIDVGEEAGAAPVGDLTVDSDDEDGEDEIIPPNVRLPSKKGSALADSDPPALNSSLPLHEAADVETQSGSTTESRKPSSARAALTSDSANPETRRNESKDRHGTEEEPLEFGLDGAADCCSFVLGKDGESPRRVTQGFMEDSMESNRAEYHANSERSTETHSPPDKRLMPSVSSERKGEPTASEYGTTKEQRSDLGKYRPLFGEERQVESAGSSILFDLLPPELAETVFEKLNGEIEWQKMRHQKGEVPRMVCCQGSIREDGGQPVYRHPSDQTLPIQPWSSTVDKIRTAAEEVAGHQLNHVLIQLYRSGNDFISEHSDKTLDVAKGSYIVNVSFGAQRNMRLRTKRNAPPKDSENSPGRTTYRVPLPHNSMIKMSLSTNAEYLHAINADKRPGCEWSEAEKAFGGQRISLTFRNIATFLNADSSRIWGQGAIAKSKEDARCVISGDAAESEKLVRAFGKENQLKSIEWESIYGEGSDVLHLS